jgi:hypothetical protein
MYLFIAILVLFFSFFAFFSPSYPLLINIGIHYNNNYRNFIYILFASAFLYFTLFSTKPPLNSFNRKIYQ